MNSQSSKRIRTTHFPATMRVLGPFRDSLLDEQIDQLLTEAFPGASPEDVENFLRSLQRFGSSAGKVAQRALPGVIQGATAGAALGPYGALVGALAGGGASLLAGSGRRPQPRPPAPTTVQPVQARPPAPTPTPILQSTTHGPAPTHVPTRIVASPAMAQLLSLLARPETMQALLSMLMGSAGRGRVAVGREQVPVQAFANSIAELASQAAQETTQIQDSHSCFSEEPYLLDEADDPRCDVYNPSERAALLVQQLNELGAKQWSEEQVLRQELEEEEDDDEVVYHDWLLDHFDSVAKDDETDFINVYESALQGVYEHG